MTRASGALTTAALAALGALAAVPTIAGCSSAPAPDRDPAAAADGLQRNLQATPAQIDCMRGRFDREPSIAAVLNASGNADADERRGYLAAIRQCIPPDAFAALLAASLMQGEAATSDQATRCVTGAVVRLAGSDLDLLYLYFSNPTVVTSQDDLDRITRTLVADCDLASIGTTVPDPGATESSGAGTVP